MKLIEKLGPTQAPPVAVGIAENKTELTRRITMIAEFRKTSFGRSMLGLVVVLLVGCVGLTDARSADSAGEKKQEAATNAPASATLRAAETKDVGRFYGPHSTPQHPDP